MIGNVRKLFVIKACGWFLLIMPIVVPFFKSNGLSMHQIFILQAVYSITIVLFEIPSGYLADVLGRKKTIILGTFLDFIGFTIYATSDDLSGFLLGEIILGLGQSMISGADSALLFESIRERDESDKNYTKEEGKMTSIGNFSEAIAGVLGGFLALISLRFPYYIQVVIAFMAIPFALSLSEPRRIIHAQQNHIKQLTETIKNTLFHHKQLSSIVIVSSITGASTLTLAWIVQPYFSEIGLPLALYGVIWTILNFSVGISSLRAHSIEKKFNRENTYLLILLVLSSSFFILSYKSLGYAGLIIIFVAYLARGIASPLFKNEINLLSEDFNRATILSIRNFLIRVIFAAIGPFCGFLMDKTSFQTAMVWTGALYTLLFMLAIAYRYIHKIKFS